VAAQSKVADLIDNRNIEAAVAVLESDLRGLERGRPALLEVPAVGETLRVEVDVISPDIDPDSRTCQVLLRFESDGRVRPGMFVRTAIAGDILPDKILVPREAILTREGRPLLFKIEDDRAKWVYVRLGLANDRFVEIERVLQGGPLDPGTLVVVSDHLTLTHEAKVKVKQVVESPSLWAKTAEE
jgi:multidrug efflux pump subunit AcrA (membrane-fusion protein)